MKSLAELQAIREKMRDKVVLREEVSNHGLNNKVTVSQTGCIGICQFEPVVEVYEAGKEKVTYVRMTPEKAREVVEKHLKSGKVIAEYTITNDRLIGG